MPKKAAPETKHAHSAGNDHTTKASGESKKGKTTLMAGIVGGLPKKSLPPTLDGIVRGVPKHGGTSLSTDTLHVKNSATKQEEGAFGAGAFAQGQMGR